MCFPWQLPTLFVVHSAYFNKLETLDSRGIGCNVLVRLSKLFAVPAIMFQNTGRLFDSRRGIEP